MIQNRLFKHYRDVVSQDLLLIRNLENLHLIPSIREIVLNSSSKLYIRDTKLVIPALVALELVSGQKVSTTWARRSIAAFKLREGTLLGCRLTLRGEKMYTFLEKLISLLMPRLREFERVLLRSYDKKGNYTVGVEGLMGFPELQLYFESFEQIRGLDITFVFNRSKGQPSQTDQGGGNQPLEEVQSLFRRKESGDDSYISIDSEGEALPQGKEKGFSQTHTPDQEVEELSLTLKESRKRTHQRELNSKQLEDTLNKKRVNHSALLLSAFQLPF